MPNHVSRSIAGTKAHRVREDNVREQANNQIWGGARYNSQPWLLLSSQRPLYIQPHSAFLRSLSNPLQKKTIEFFDQAFILHDFDVITWLSSENWCFPSWDLHRWPPVRRFSPINLSISSFFLYLVSDRNEETWLTVWTNFFEQMNALSSLCYDLLSFVDSFLSCFIAYPTWKAVFY